MLIELDHHSGVPIYRQIIDQLTQMIVTAELTPGTQLETVRDLAKRLKVNPMTVSKAYAFMENDGLLERKRGIGLFVAIVDQADSEQIKLNIFIDIMKKAALASAQMGLPKDKALEIFQQCLGDAEGKQ